MKHKVLIPSFLLILIIIAGVALNLKVITKQGVNYKVSEIELPLYLKILNFYDRHFNYRWLVNRITKNLEKKEDKLFRLFEWTYHNIQPQPESLPIMDDHVWSVYVRGYGIDENFNDLFTTLCNYIGVDAFFLNLKIKESDRDLGISFVKLEKGWVLFDPYNGVYFFNNLGSWATIAEINEQNWRLKQLGATEISESFYRPYLKDLPNIGDVVLNRANTQSPINRLLLVIQRISF
jgi:hypothetical protein